jgi:hypothetical protein
MCMYMYMHVHVYLLRGIRSWFVRIEGVVVHLFSRCLLHAGPPSTRISPQYVCVLVVLADGQQLVAGRAVGRKRLGGGQLGAMCVGMGPRSEVSEKKRT